ncbi:MAG TPA: thiol:disulfide interchange protein DsbA/DsbL [Xanthomonadaceae bacterium]|nr:thiol:disulfide interchange protein DsbA/DsbL [Xanthomonadaceae bacterium]
MLMRLNTTLAILLLATACTAQTPPPAGFEAGKHYYVIDPPQPQARNDTIEVVEVFSYACIHCANAQPFVNEWQKSLPPDVTFYYLPTAFGGGAEAFARAYYTAETMGVLDRTHDALFRAFHIEQRQFRNLEDIAAFFGELGVDKDQALATMDSFAVNAKIARAQQVVPRYQIEGTPTMIVAGKYRVVSTRDGFEAMLEVVDHLVDKERAERQQGG